ncbi:Serine/threonine-protein kinase CTR1 [Platanthera zijinensis]|uniref:non-specific serine/threonine protein kinase n=1 Tax=Platanthera zijinensis TaxID=2320716 RepID=A0AAP0G6F6_9ASPA
MGERRSDLVKRFHDLEVSQAELRKQLELLLRNGGEQEDISNRRGRGGWRQDTVMMVGNFVRNPYQVVLHQLGHGLHICRPASGEIIYWNRAAEVLYGWKSYELLGQKITDLLIDKGNYLYWESIMERACGGGKWSGHLSFRKKSGELFTALVTVSPLYENGECIGVIIVSSDASVLSNAKSEGLKTHSEDTNSQQRETNQNFRRVHWPPHPLLTSSVSNLTEKVLAKLHIRVNGSQALGFNGYSKTNLACASADDSFHNDLRREISRLSTRDAECCASCFARVVRCAIPEENSDVDALGRSYHEETKILVSRKNGSASLAQCHTTPMANGNIMHNGDNLIEDVSEEATISKNSTSPNMEDIMHSRGDQSGSSSACEIEPNLVADSEIRWEDLVLGEEIGEGSYAVVYRGLWNGSDVAIKVYARMDYRESILLDYKKEIAIMKKLRHPNVLLFMGAACSSERLAIVTEYLPRGSLFKALHKNNQALDMKRRLRMALDVAKGMNYLHRRNPPIIHRDLKSSNLLVDKSWTVKVGDFGLSCLKISTVLTAKTGRGTPQWMAPEVLRGECTSEKSDVFSFGVILWELMTESIPWGNLNSMQVVGVVGFMDRRLDIPSGIDPMVAATISDCWASDPYQRPSFQNLVERVTELTLAAMASPPPAHRRL